MSSLAQRLAAHVERGYPVFPCKPDKAPLTPRGFLDATTDRATIQSWYKAHRDALWGSPTGAETGLLVIDVDPDGAGWLTEHFADLGCGFIVQTRRENGRHLYYEYPAGLELRNSASKIAPGVDVRANGGYVIAWAVHGHTTVGEPADIGPPPQWLIERLGSQNRRIAGGNGSLKIGAGGRNDHLIRMAGALAGQGFDQDAILASLRAENAQRCDPPLDDDEIQRTVMQSATRWSTQSETASQDEPEPLRRPVPPAAEYPLAALGDILGPAAQRIAEVVQAPPAICGQSILAAASLAVQAHADVVIDGRHEPLSLWCISIAESGERKSAADDIALEPHRAHERVAADTHRRDMVAHEAETAAYEEQRRQIVKSKVVSLEKMREVSEAIENNLRKLGSAPPPPLEPWLLVSTPTLEGLHKLYQDGRPSLGLFHDDGGEFLGGHSMSSENRMKSAAGMSKLWDRGEFDRIRASDGRGKYFGRRLALHLLVQPVIAETILGDALLCGQGFLARCLLAWPSTRIGTRRYVETDLSADPALVEYRRVMTELLDRRQPTRPEAPQELEPRALQLTAEAKRRWITLHNHIEESMRDGGELAGVRAWGSKSPAQILRVAGVLTLVSDPAAAVVGLEAMDQAAELVLHALEEAVRIVGTTSVSDEIRHAQALLDWCRASGITQLHSRAALRLGPACIRSKDVFDRAIRELERAGSAVPVAGGAELDGARRRRVWEIHS